MHVRPFESRDAACLADIFFSAVHDIAAGHYSDEQIRAWAPMIPDPSVFVARNTDGRTLLVAVDENDIPLAYGDLERDGHIDHLYCRPDVAGTGVAVQLYRALEGVAREQQNPLVYVEASEPARRFFGRQGFQVIARREIELGGVRIYNFRMEKQLRPETEEWLPG